ncbi:unnamed protein product [Porites lobata]|uniref:Elongator complex protein 4 n=1 Tax=Porites lobata TaxID=104759 RepID=A0ABN8PMW0_9CNID|nr:unnamed protein product [Porites lobata]
MATSFKKKGSRGRAVYPPGTRPSLHNSQLLISSGVPSMDNVVGEFIRGGIAIGTIFMVEEDTYSSYAWQLSKYFLAEGVVCSHALFLASAEPEPSNILKDLPQQTDEADTKTTVSSEQGQRILSTDQSMKIAWRYQNQPKFESSPSPVKFGHYFDLTRTMDDQKVSSVPIHTFSVSSEMSKCLECSAAEKRSSLQAGIYSTLISKVKSIIRSGGFTTSDKGLENRSILRVVLQGVGSALWGEDQHGPYLTRFLFQLRAVMRSSLAVCFITVPTHLFQDTALTRRVERLCDTVLKLESFVGSENETNAVYKDYHGLFHIIRLPRLNSLVSHVPDSFDLAFKLRRKKMSIEKLHLPPDLSETVSRSQEDSVRGKPGSLSCQSTKSLLDF